MLVELGFSGWVRARDVPTLPDGALVYVRFHHDIEAARLDAVEIYIESCGGERLRGEHLRRLPLDLIEAEASVLGFSMHDGVADLPGPLLGTAASYLHFGCPADDEPRNWALDMLRSQCPELGVPEAQRVPLTRRTKQRPAPAITSPEGRYTAQWYSQLARAYVHAVRAWRVEGGDPPAKALAAQAGVSVHTVRSWIYRARRAGYLNEGRQGQAG